MATAVLFAGIIAIVLPVQQIGMLGANLRGIIGRYDYGGGYYQVIYTGGTQTSSSAIPMSKPIVGGSGNAYASGTSASASCSGTITATFTWFPGPNNEPVPDSVIVEEDVTAEVYDSSPGTFSVNDGLGDTSTSSQTVSGKRWSVKSGGTFTTSVTPAVSYTALPATPSIPKVTAGSSEDYSVFWMVPVINVSGTTVIPGQVTPAVLIGQQLVATLDVGNLNPVHWTWDSEGDPFEGFSVNNQNMSGSAQELMDSDRHHASFSYFYRSIGDITTPPPDATGLHNTHHITCVATITFLDNTQAQITVSTTVDVYQPDHTMKVLPGKVDGIPDANGNLVAWGMVPLNAPGHGITWKGTVTTPYWFLHEEETFTNSVGSWQYVQILTNIAFSETAILADKKSHDQVKSVM